MADGLDEFVGHVERLTQERRAGRILTPEKLTPLEWEALLIWDEVEDSYRLAHEARAAQMFEILVAKLAS